MGLSGGQLLRRVELPLAVPYLAAGFRTAAVQVIATAALASFVNGGGLGQIIRPGFGLDIAAGGGQIVAGGVLVAGLALLAELILGWSNGWSPRVRCAVAGSARARTARRRAGRPDRRRWPDPSGERAVTGGRRADR